MGEIKLNPNWGNVTEISLMNKRERDPRIARRLNAIRLLMQGYSRQQVDHISGVSRQTLHSWIKKWNDQGREGGTN